MCALAAQDAHVTREGSVCGKMKGPHESSRIFLPFPGYIAGKIVVVQGWAGSGHEAFCVGTLVVLLHRAAFNYCVHPLVWCYMHEYWLPVPVETIHG